MAIRTAIPWLTGGALMAAGMAYAYVRRDTRPRLRAVGSDRLIERDPVGPDDAMVEVLGLASEPKVKTEAEAIAGAGAGWPMMPDAGADDDDLSTVRDTPLTATMPDRDFVPGNDRAELSSMLGAHPLGLDASQAGEELVDVGAVEVPVGRSADTEYGPHLLKDKLVQRDTTGGVLEEPNTRSGFSQVDSEQAYLDIEVDFDDLDRPTGEQTVGLMEHPAQANDGYDAIEPEDMGTTFLARATQAGPLGSDDPIDDLAEIPSTEPMPMVSEASDQAALSPDDRDPRSRNPLSDDDDVPRDVWDAMDRPSRG